MDAFLAHRRLTAAATRAAQPIASLRHVHLAAEPFVVCSYHLAGDEGAPLAFTYGRDRAKPKTIVIGEPDRDLRFRGLTSLATDVNAYIEGFSSRSPVYDRNGRQKVGRFGPQRLADDAPQIVVPNAGTADWLALLARSTVWLRTDGENPVNPILPRMGAHLTQITGQRTVAGSASLIAATEILDKHWTTGQTDFEDANLATLLAWVDPAWLRATGVHIPTGLDAVTAAAIAEGLPSAGPVSDPSWDEEELAPLIGALNEARRAGRPTRKPLNELISAVADQLAPTWVAVWRAVDLARALPEARSVAGRWESDRWAWTSHLNRIDTGTAFFRRYRTAIQSARLLATSENAVAAVEADMAFDDPLVMARYVADGTAVEGVITHRDDDHRVTSASGRQLRHPLLRLRCDDEVLVPVGTEVTLAGDTRVRGEIAQLPTGADHDITIVVHAGMRAGILPVQGERALFAAFSPPVRYPSTLPDAVPWTHILPEPPNEAEVA